MQALRTVAKSENGQLLIQLPDFFHNIELEVIILPASITDHLVQEVNPNGDARLQMVAHLKGSLPNVSYSKYDFYEQ